MKLKTFSGGAKRKMISDIKDQLEFEKESFLNIFPGDIKQKIVEINEFDNLIEVVLDLGRKPEARFVSKTEYLRDDPVTREEIRKIILKFGEFDRDNRAGIEKTLHRISAIFNRKDEVVGLTCRVGRAVYGTIDPIKDIIKGEKSILLLGKPGVGKTTLLREAGRVLSEEMNKRVIVVDTSNEIGGDGDVPHPGIGNSRRMQVPFGRAQEDVMIEAVENHFPEVIIIDEIGRTEEAKACRTIAERGVRLIATAHGNTIDNLMVNPTLQDLIGGITSVTLSDEEAFRRGTQKTILERRSPPTFDILIEIRERGVYAIYHDVADTVDALLRGFPVTPEIRSIRPREEVEEKKGEPSQEFLEGAHRKTRIFILGINSSYVERAIHSTRAQVEVVKDLDRADIILADKKVLKRKEELVDFANKVNIHIDVVEKPSLNGIKDYLRRFREKNNHHTTKAFERLESVIKDVLETGYPGEVEIEDEALLEEEKYIIERYGLRSEIVGLSPNRRLMIFPRKR